MRIWKESSWTYFEIVDGHRRLVEVTNTIERVPSILSILTEHLLSDLSEYQKCILKKHKKLDDDRQELVKRLENAKKKGYVELIHDYKKRVDDIEGEMRKYEDLAVTVSTLIERLKALLPTLNEFIELRRKVWVGREW